MTSIISQALAATFTCIVSTLALAKPISYQAVIRAELTPLSSERYDSARVFLDGRKGLIELSLQPRMPTCEPGLMCAQVLPEPVVYNLEQAKSQIDRCGIIRTVAAFDQTPVDGISLKVTISNNRNNKCPTFVALPPLTVELEKTYYSFETSGNITQIDSFEAQDFAAIKPAAK